jgi:hypothetical protein
MTEYGPAHVWYSIAICSIVAFSVIIVIYAFCHQKTVSIKNSIILLVVMFIMISTFFVKKIVGTNVELMPMFYSALVMILFILHRRADIYDISYAILDALEQEMYGYIV